MARKKKREILEASIEEITITAAPATGIPFMLCKSKGGAMEDLKTLIEKFLGEGFSLAKISAGAAAALKEALELLGKYKDELPDDVLAAIKTIAALASAGVEAEPEPEGKPKPKPPREGIDPRAAVIGYEKRAGDHWPSIMAAAGEVGGVILRPSIQKSEDGDEDDDEPAPLIQRRGVRKSIDSQVDDGAGAGDDGPADLWPSLSR